MAGFIDELFTILENIILPRMEIALKNTEQATYMYTNFYESIYDKKNRVRHFSKYHDLRRRYNAMDSDEKKKKLYKIKELIKYNDYNLHAVARKLKVDYSDLMEEQPFLCEAFLKAVCPPEFGKDSKGKTYPKILIANSSSSRRLYDVGRVSRSP